MRAAVLVLSLVLGCGGAQVFECRQDADCGGMAGGACEPDGWCSFPDDACASGRRYGHWVGDGLADTCVPTTVADTGSSGPSPTTTTSSSSTSSSAEASSSGGADSSSTVAVSASETSAGSTTVIEPTTEGESSSTGDRGPELVAWYRFDERTFAGTVIDSANGHDGICDADTCPLAMPGVAGNAAFFDGVDDIVRIPHHADFLTDGGFTLAAWVMLTGPQDGFRAVVAKPIDARDNRDCWELGRDENGMPTANLALDESTSAFATSDTALPEGTWVHLAATWDGATLVLYVDGVEQASAPAASILLSEHDANFGASWDFGIADDFLTGALDELQIWRRPLSPDEIQALLEP